MFSVVNVYLDHLKLCVVCINCRMYVGCNECNVVSDDCNVATSCLVQPIGTHGGLVLYFRCVSFRVELGFLNCDDVSMCVVNKQFELLEFLFDSVYVDLRPCVLVMWYVCEVVVVPYVDAALAVAVMRALLFVLDVCMLRECECTRVTEMPS